jgi:KaiC
MSSRCSSSGAPAGGHRQLQGPAQARRVVIDSLMDLQMAAVDDTRFREFMYSLAQRFSRQGTSLLITYETPDLFEAGRMSHFAASHLSDNTIVLNYHRDHRAMSRSLAIVKARASNHDPAMRQFRIGPDGISLAAAAIPDGNPEPDRLTRPGVTGLRCWFKRWLCWAATTRSVSAFSSPWTRVPSLIGPVLRMALLRPFAPGPRSGW